MSMICKLYGHQMPDWNDYHKIVGDQVDGIGRWHGHLQCECPRCGQVVSSGMVHLPLKNFPPEVLINCTKQIEEQKEKQKPILQYSI